MESFCILSSNPQRLSNRIIERLQSQKPSIAKAAAACAKCRHRPLTSGPLHLNLIIQHSCLVSTAKCIEFHGTTHDTFFATKAIINKYYFDHISENGNKQARASGFNG